MYFIRENVDLLLAHRILSLSLSFYALPLGVLGLVFDFIIVRNLLRVQFEFHNVQKIRYILHHLIHCFKMDTDMHIEFLRPANCNVKFSLSPILSFTLITL